MVTPLLTRTICCRHEAIVLDTPIEIVHVDDNVLVVNKPCSLPVDSHRTVV